MPELKFRNLGVTPDDPVEQWGVEGILAAIDRGSLRYWNGSWNQSRRTPKERSPWTSPRPLSLQKTPESSPICAEPMIGSRRERHYPSPPGDRPGRAIHDAP